MGLYVIRELFEEFLRAQHEQDAFEFSKFETVLGGYKDKVLSTIKKARNRDVNPNFSYGIPQKAHQKKLRSYARKFNQILSLRQSKVKHHQRYSELFSSMDLIQGLGMLTDLFVSVWRAGEDISQAQDAINSIGREIELWLDSASEFTPQESAYFEGETKSPEASLS